MVVSTSPDGTLTQPLSATEAVAVVLCKGRRKPTFLKNVGLVSSRTKATKSQLQLQLDAERAGKQELQALVHDFQMSTQQREADKNNAQEQIRRCRKAYTHQRKIKKMSLPFFRSCWQQDNWKMELGSQSGTGALHLWFYGGFLVSALDEAFWCPFGRLKLYAPGGLCKAVKYTRWSSLPKIHRSSMFLRRCSDNVVGFRRGWLKCWFFSRCFGFSRSEERRVGKEC